VHNLVTTVTGLLAENVGPVDAVKRCFPPGKPLLHLSSPYASHRTNELMGRINDRSSEIENSPIIGGI
jgi:hypothetical protein